jgi:hypothetical protein
MGGIPCIVDVVPRFDAERNQLSLYLSVDTSPARGGIPGPGLCRPLPKTRYWRRLQRALATQRTPHATVGALHPIIAEDEEGVLGNLDRAKRTRRQILR